MDLPIKKSNIAINTADTRPSRFTGGERIDCAIAELDSDKLMMRTKFRPIPTGLVSKYQAKNFGLFLI